MKKWITAAVAVSASASFASAGQIAYDGFAYDATGNPPLGTGPSSATGAPGAWIYQGNNTVEPRINAGSLSYPGLPASIGNKVQLDTTTPTGADGSRLYLGTMDKATVPTLYYSFITSIPSSANTNQAGAFFAGFDNLTAGTAYTTFGGLFVRQDAGDTTNVDLGISTSGSLNKAWTAALPHDTPIFVVASFTFQGLSTLDVYTDPTAVPVAEPGPHLATSTAADASAVTTVSNFYLRGNSGEPQAIKIDEVRVGTAWADVAAHAYYWDVDGTTAGPGGAAPSGTWDGATTNFNSDATGGGGGFFVASPTGADSVDFSAGSDATGTYTVTVSGTRSAAAVNVKAGSVTFAGGTLAVGRFDVAADATATVNSALTGSATLTTAGSVTKTGPGTLTLPAPNGYTGATTVTGGTLVLGDSLTTTSSVLVNGGTLELSAGGGNNRVLKAPAVTVTGTGKIDLKDNKLITGSATGTWNGSAYTGITGLVAAGKGDGTWNGSTGIVTSVAGASDYTSLGVASGTDVRGLTGTATDTFAGQTIHAGDTVVMFTYGGDANLDGLINIDDYTQIDSSVSTGGALKGWVNGDFNYDGEVNIDDYTIIDSNIGIQGTPFSNAGGISASPAALSGVTAVPEPASLGLVALAAGAMIGRRRRRNG